MGTHAFFFKKRSSSVSCHIHARTCTRTVQSGSTVQGSAAIYHPWRRMSGGSGEDTEAEHLRFRAELPLRPNLLLFFPNLGIHRTVSNLFFFFLAEYLSHRTHFRVRPGFCSRHRYPCSVQGGARAHYLQPTSHRTLR